MAPSAFASRNIIKIVGSFYPEWHRQTVLHDCNVTFPIAVVTAQFNHRAIVDAAGYIPFHFKNSL